MILGIAVVIGNHQPCSSCDHVPGTRPASTVHNTHSCFLLSSSCRDVPTGTGQRRGPLGSSVVRARRGEESPNREFWPFCFVG